MQLRKIAGVFFACVIAFSVRAATDESLLFYCNFDGSANATFSRGESAAKCVVPPEFQPGVRGQAVVIGGNTSGVQTIVNDLPTNTLQELNCCYAPDKNLDVHRGSVSFWVKPLDWDGNTKGFNVLFYTQAGKNFFQLYKFFSDDLFLFLRGDQDKGWTSVENRMRYWKTGEWHHVVATWGLDELKMYIDGARVCSRKVRVPLDNTTPVQPFSVGPGGAWKHAFVGRSLVDEFRIHDRPLSDDEVVSLYRQDSAAVEIDSGLVTVGQKTPVLDGKINDFEYAFSGSGFNDLKGYISPQQGFYYFSYDRSNLYLAVSSDIGAEKPAPVMERDGAFESSERVEVYLVPEPAEKSLYRFVLTSSGGIYDEKNGEKQWNSAGLKLAGNVSNGVWIAEAVIPFADLGLKAAPDSQKWRVNIGRVFVSPPAAVAIAPVKGALDDQSQFITLVFRPDAPLIRIASWTNMVKEQTAEDVSVQTTNNLAEITLERISDTTLAYGLRSRSSPLVSKGKATPQKSQVWSMQQDFILGESRIVEKAGGKETTLYVRKTIYENDDPMRTFFLYTQAKKRLFVSAWHKAEANIRARFLKPDGTCAFEAIQPIPKDSAYFNALFDLDFGKLIPGDYTIKIDYVAPDGKALETWEQAIRIPKPDDPMFKPYVDPEADKVPAPWTPLKSGGEKVAMWGREYDFSKGFLFSSLKSQGEEILAGPAALRLDGETLSPSGEVGLDKKAGTDMLAEWEKKADLGKIKVESRIRTHFDGYCEVAMTVSPAGKEQVIKSLSLDIPLRPEAATLVRDNRISFLDKSRSGAVTDGWHQDLFNGRGYFIWVGNDRVGFNWLAPDLANWSCRKTEKSVEIVRQGDASILRFNLADTPANWAEARTIKFGFILTPSRPLDQKIHRMRNHRDLQMWCQPWEYFAVPDYDTASRAEIERETKRYGLDPKEVFLYMGIGLTSPFMPEWAWWEEEWRGNSKFGEWTGNFKDPKIRGRACYTGGTGPTYLNFLQNKRRIFFEKARTPITPKARNYYFDTGATTAGWYREQDINVYRMIRRTGPEAKIWGHQGWLRSMPMQHFTDIICGGEGIEGMLEKDGGYYNILTPEMFRATFSPRIWGIKMVFLYMGFGRDPEKDLNFSLDKPEYRKSVFHAYGYCLVHDVDICTETALDARLIREVMQPMWAAQDVLGWDERIVFHPYWEQGAVKLVSPQSSRIMASAYTKDGKMLLAILNDTDKEETVRLELDLGKLGAKEGLNGHDVWVPEDKFTLASRWEVKLPPRGFRLIIFNDK